MEDLFAPPSPEELIERDKTAILHSPWKDKFGTTITRRKMDELWGNLSYRKVKRTVTWFGEISTVWVPYTFMECCFETAIICKHLHCTLIMNRYSTIEEACVGHKWYSSFSTFYYFEEIVKSKWREYAETNSFAGYSRKRKVDVREEISDGQSTVTYPGMPGRH